MYDIYIYINILKLYSNNSIYPIVYIYMYINVNISSILANTSAITFLTTCTTALCEHLSKHFYEHRCALTAATAPWRGCSGSAS